MSADFSQIRFITANYSRLQGLRELPAGILVVFVSIWARYNQGPNSNLTAPMLVTLGVMMLYWLIDRYYTRKFGRVIQSRNKRVRELITSILFAILALLAFWVDTAVDLPFSMLGLVVAAALFLDFWQATESVRSKAFACYPENVIAAALILLVSVLPILGIPWWEFLGLRSQVFGVFMVMGVCIILAGIWGHLRILRSLPIREIENENAV